jgi:cell division protein FtsB
MTFLEGKSQREKILLIGLIVSLIFGTYLMIRVKPVIQDTKKTEELVKKQERKYNRLLKETDNIKPSNVLLKEVSGVEEKLKKEKQSLNGLDLSFVDLSNQEAVHSLITEITIAAENNNLQVLGKQNEMLELTSLVGKNTMILNNSGNATYKNKNKNKKSIAKGGNVIADNKNLKRHMFKLQVKGTFSSVYNFITTLNDFRYSVLIARIKLYADEENTYNGRRLVTTDLTLAI